MQDLRWPTYRSRDLVLDAAPTGDGSPTYRVRDSAGREYLDAVGGIGCLPLGHGHPAWLDAVTGQLHRLVSSANTFFTAPQQRLAARLVELFPIDDARVFLCNSGTEATEAALKLVLRATGRDVVIAFEGAFHGRTLGAVALTANPKYREPWVSCPGDEHPGRFAHMAVVRVPFGDAAALEAAFERHRGRVAAVFVEPIQGEAGVFPATRAFLLAVRALCDRHGALLAVDEIQSGCGRTGTWAAWTGIVGDEARPDVLWLAKALGGGFPVAACLARGDLAARMGAGTHGTTFGGNPVACAASLATLRILEEEGLLAKAAVQIDVVRAQAARRPLAEVTEIRGRGAMIGIQVGPATEERAAPLAEAMSQRGVLVTICGGHTVRLLLPYGAGAPELSQVWDVLAESIAATA